MRTEGQGDLAVVVRLVGQEALEDRGPRVELELVAVPAFELGLEHLRRPRVEDTVDDGERRFEGADELVRGPRVLEVVLPGVSPRVGERRRVGARLAKHRAQPVDARCGDVPDDRPYGPVLRLRAEGKLLVPERTDGLDEPPVVLR